MQQVSDELINHLCHQIFIGTPQGKKLLELLKARHLATPVFPTDHNTIERHGGPLAWAAFCAGRLEFVLELDSNAMDFEQKLMARNTINLR